MIPGLLEIGQTDVDVVAVVGLLGFILKAYTDGRLMGPNRRKIVQDASSLATDTATNSLREALETYKEYNLRLRGDVGDLEDRVEDVITKLRAVEAERDELELRLQRANARLDQAGLERT